MSEELKYQGHGLVDWQLQCKRDWEEVEHTSWLARKAQEMADKAVKQCQRSTKICVALSEGRMPKEERE